MFLIPVPVLVSKKKTTIIGVPAPANWPARHHKCTSSVCLFPNPPQVAAGTYVCLGGTRHGLSCTGKYFVDPVIAEAEYNRFRRAVDREEEVKRRAEARAQTEEKAIIHAAA